MTVLPSIHETGVTPGPHSVVPGPQPEISVPQAKRALEWYSSSQKFRDLVETDPVRAGEDYALGFNPELIRPLYDPFYAIEVQRHELPTHPVVQAYREFFVSKTRWRDQVKKECSPDEPRFKAWRRRQVARSALESGGYDDFLIHTPLAIEITDGCSVGCWFCGVGSTRVGESWLYSDEHAAEWRRTLTLLRRKIGRAARWGFLYWATDPLDNPDYEHLASDFADIMGVYPQTTTAQAHKDPGRVKRLLAVSQARGCRVNRFSVLTEKLLRRIYADHTPEELTQVEIVAQMPTATTAKADAGAFRERAARNDKVVEREMEKLHKIATTSRELAELDGAEVDRRPLLLAQPGTIACVSGFLLNMVTRRVKLISPCVASERWPLGYIVFDERTFAGPRDLEEILEDMMDIHMPDALAEDDDIRFHPDLTFTKVDDGFQVQSRRNALSFVRKDLADYVRALGDMVHAGGRSASQIAMALFYRHGVPEENTLGTLDALFRGGLLVDRLGRIAGETGAAAS